MRLDGRVLAPLARGVALGSKAPRVGFGGDGAGVVDERGAVRLLDRALRELRRLFLDRQQHTAADEPVALADRAAPAKLGAAVHGMDAGQAADVAGHDAVHREQDRRRRDARGGPVWIAVADAVRPVADRVPRRDLDVGLGARHVTAHARAQRGQRLVGDRRKRHGTSLSRSARRSTLPAGVRGNASITCTARGYSCRLSRVLTHSWISRSNASPARSATTKAFGTCPRAASVTAITAASRTSGWRSSTCSISTALIVQPAEMMTSSERPAWWTYPSASIQPRSFTGNHVPRRRTAISPIAPVATGTPVSSTTATVQPGAAEPRAPGRTV